MKGKVTGYMIEVYTALQHFARNVRFKNVQQLLNILYCYAYHNDDDPNMVMRSPFSGSSSEIQISRYPEGLDIEEFERLVNMRLVENELGVYIKIEADWVDNFDYREDRFKRARSIYVTIYDTTMIVPGSDIEKVLCI